MVVTLIVSGGAKGHAGGGQVQRRRAAVGRTAVARAKKKQNWRVEAGWPLVPAAAPHFLPVPKPLNSSACLAGASFLGLDELLQAAGGGGQGQEGQAARGGQQAAAGTEQAHGWQPTQGS